MNALVLPVLIALPFAVAAFILAVSALRRRRHARAHGPREPVHRAQAATAAAQSASIPPAPTGRKPVTGRERRARSARTR